MSTLSERSTCISWRSVSSPSISGISTSRMMKSGRSPSPTRSSASLPLDDRVDFESVHFQQRLKIFADARFVIHHQNLFFVVPSSSLRASSPSRSYSTSVGSRKEKELPLPYFAIDPDFSAMRLNQALGDRQSQADPRGRRIDAHELFKNLLMKFRGDSVARIGHGNQHAVRARAAVAAAILRGRRVRKRGAPRNAAAPAA